MSVVNDAPIQLRSCASLGPTNRLPRSVTGSAASWSLATLGTAEASPAHHPARGGFDLSPVTLAEGPDLPSSTNPGSQPVQEASPADQDSQPVLEQKAREGDTEALAKEAQNPVANLISLLNQWNATPGTQWAPRELDPSAEDNRTLNVWNVQPVVPF